MLSLSALTVVKIGHFDVAFLGRGRRTGHLRVISRRLSQLNAVAV